MIRVLLVDDEPMANTTLRHLLKAFPSVEVAGVCTEPEAALEFCAARPVDAVFLDIEMPRVKGMELADKIRRLLPEVWLVFVTAYPDYALRAFDISALDYLLKPVGRDRLACTSTGSSDKRRTRRQTRRRPPGNGLSASPVPAFVVCWPRTSCFWSSRSAGLLP